MKKMVCLHRFLLIGIFIFLSSTKLLAENVNAVISENGMMMGLLVIILILLFFVVYNMWTQKKQISTIPVPNSATFETEREMMEQKNLKFQKMNEELATEKENLMQDKETLAHRVEEMNASIASLIAKNKELHQAMMDKVYETEKITREKEEQYAGMVSKYEEVDKLHNSFLTNAVHEMRTPLSLILGTLSQVIQNHQLESEVSAQILSAYRNTLALQDLTDQLKDVRHGDDVANHLRVARYDLVDITKLICDLFVDWIAMNNVDFQINLQTRAMWVWTDRRKFEFALRVLLSNALRNTFAYGRIILNIEVTHVNGKAFCELYVQDEGLDEESNARLGLKQIVDWAEGFGGGFQKTIIKSDVDGETNNTRYTLLIPLGKQYLLDQPVEFVEPDGDLLKLNQEQKDSISDFIQIVPIKKITGKKMLVIDDSDQIRWFLKHVFGKEYQIVEARNGEEGIRVAREEVPDVILCDVMMPVMDGFEACRAIKTDSVSAQCSVLMLTAKVESEDVIKGLECGAEDYITKPFDVEVLRSKISGVLRRKEQMRQYYSSTLVGGIPVAQPEDTNSVASAFMNSVTETIEKYLGDPTFEAKILADALNVSLPTLYRKIKMYSDCSILELTRTVRLKKAAQLVLERKYSIQEISEMVGFNDTATFRKRFTEQYGVTPSQYGQ